MQYISDEKIIHSMNDKNKPIGKVKSGEKFIIKTRSPGIPDDVFIKEYHDEKDYPERVLSITGPVEIEDVEPGDTLEIVINDIKLDSKGKMWMGQWMGLLMDEVERPYLKKVEVDEFAVKFNDEINIPLRPMIGTLGVSPTKDDIPCLIPGDHGANIDVPNVTTGNKLFLRAQVPGGLVSVGDVHAAMGDAEIFGTGVEIGSEVTLTINVIKEIVQNTPFIETPEIIEIIFSHQDMLEAAKGVTRKAIDFVQEHTDLIFEEAYALIGQAGNLKIAQIVNPLYTLTMELPKYILKNYEERF